MGLKSALPPPDGLARTLTAVGVMSAESAPYNSSKRAAGRCWLVPVGAATMLAAGLMILLASVEHDRRVTVLTARTPHKLALRQSLRMSTPQGAMRASDRARPGRARNLHADRSFAAAPAEMVTGRKRVEPTGQTGAAHAPTWSLEAAVYRIGTNLHFNRRRSRATVKSAVYVVDRSPWRQSGERGDSAASTPPAKMEKRPGDTQIVRDVPIHVQDTSLDNICDLLRDPAPRSASGLDLSVAHFDFSSARLISAAVERNIFKGTAAGTPFFRSQRGCDLFGLRRDDKPDRGGISMSPGEQSNVLTAIPPDFKKVRVGRADIRHAYSADLSFDRSIAPTGQDFRQPFVPKTGSVALASVDDAAPIMPFWLRPHDHRSLSTRHLPAGFLNTLGIQHAGLFPRDGSGSPMRLVTCGWPLRLDSGGDADVSE